MTETEWKIRAISENVGKKEKKYRIYEPLNKNGTGNNWKQMYEEAMGKKTKKSRRGLVERQEEKLNSFKRVTKRDNV